MKVKFPVVIVDLLYSIMVAIDVRATFKAHSRGEFWILGGAILWIILVGVYLSLKHWPIISFPKPESERINGATYTQPILAWRLWRMHGDSLESLNFRRGAWLPKTRFYAVCGRYGYSEETIPQATCSCGVYARKEMDYRFWRDSQHTTSVADPAGVAGIFPAVLGLVYLWGNIVEGEDGYRAQYAYPAKLFAVGQEKGQVRAIAYKYGIPYQEFTRWQNHKFKHGGTRWISEQSKESLRLNLLSFLSPRNENQSQSRIA